VLLRVEAILLVLLAILLAGPVATVFARASWPRKAPRAALVLWQAVGLACGLSILGAGLTLAAPDIGGHWLQDLGGLYDHRNRLGLIGWSGIALTVLVGAWLVAVFVASSTRIVLRRRAHRRILDLVAADGVPSGVRMLDHPVATAYCVPGFRPRIVLSSGVFEVLDDSELQAVLAHERAHARGRHDLVVQPFIAWRDTFPFLRSARTGLAAVEQLVEMLADDAAVRRCGMPTLCRSLERLDAARIADPDGMDRAGAARAVGQLDARLLRLSRPRPRLGLLASAGIYLGSLLLVCVPPAILLCS
jgi:Zn-dependent protease with chaperone function